MHGETHTAMMIDFIRMTCFGKFLTELEAICLEEMPEICVRIWKNKRFRCLSCLNNELMLAAKKRIEHKQVAQKKKC